MKIKLSFLWKGEKVEICLVNKINENVKKTSYHMLGEWLRDYEYNEEKQKDGIDKLIGYYEKVSKMQ